MTQAEFAKGWKLLILQPWGWRYRTLTDEGDLTEESKTQMDFYYDTLKYGHPDAWMQTVKIHAAGKEWPNLNEIRDTLSHYHRRALLALTDQTPKEKGVPMPDEIRKQFEKDGILKTMPSE